jgi:hypothetical protein
MTEPTAAISSSAWKVLTPNRLSWASSWRMSEPGVIGYEPQNSGSLERTLAATSPYDSAWLPVMLR